MFNSPSTPTSRNAPPEHVTVDHGSSLVGAASPTPVPVDQSTTARPVEVLLAEARRLGEAATEGPWTQASPSSAFVKCPKCDQGEYIAQAYLSTYGKPHHDPRADAEFIAASRTLVVELADRVATLAAENEQLTIRTGEAVQEAASWRAVAHNRSVSDLVAERDAARERAESLAAAVERLTRSCGATLIVAERVRQVEQEGYSPEHDARHAAGELARAGAAYASRGHAPIFWPWRDAEFKPNPDNRMRELVKAGALIAAEIDRLAALAGRSS